MFIAKILSREPGLQGPRQRYEAGILPLVRLLNARLELTRELTASSHLSDEHLSL